MAAADGPLTRSRIEAFDQAADVLAELGERLRAGGPVLRRAADVYVEQIDAPDGTAWAGTAARRFLQEAQPDQHAVNRAVEHAGAMADIAERAGDYLRGARESTLEAITQAEEDEFTVGEDLSVTDNYVWGSPVERMARQQDALAHRNFIAHWAARLEAANTGIAARLHAGAAEMTAMTPAHWRQPNLGYGQPVSRDGDVNTTPDRKGTIHAVGHGWKQDPPLGPDPANMTPEQARDAYERLKRDIESHNSSPPVVTNKAAVDAYNARADALNARKAALEAKLGVSETVPALKHRLVPDWAHPAPSTTAHPRPPSLDLTTPHARELGTDPATGGGFRASEAETGLRVEAQRGISLQRSPHPGADWIDRATGDTYHAVGNFDGRYLNLDKFMKDIDDHLEKAKYVPVDISQFSAEQRSEIRRFIAGIGPRAFIVGDYGSGG